MRRVLSIVVLIGVCYYGWQWARPEVVKFVCQNVYNESLTTASQFQDTATKTEAMRNKAQAAYKSCLEEWGVEEGDPLPNE